VTAAARPARLPRLARVARLVVANLTAEEELGGRRGGFSAKALATVSGLATLMRVFAGEDDTVHLPAAVDAGRIPELPGLPRPRLASGRLARLERIAPPAAVLAWAETAAVGGLRQGLPEPPAIEPTPAHPTAALAELLWSLPPPSPEAAARANHRSFCLEVAESLGVALPGARRVATPGEVEAALGRRDGPWVLKAPWSAAGRERLHLAGVDALPRALPRLAALLARHGELLLEPWMDRTEDFGCVAIATGDGVRPVAFHRQLTDRHGQPAGFRLAAALPERPFLPGAEGEALDRTLEGVAAALARIGYRGPFGIDLWRHRLPDGRIVLHPLGEINARMTLGLLARAWADRLGGTLGLEPGGEAEIHLGAAPARAASLPLLLPDAGDADNAGGAAGAWISALP
jgi:hypothetical protein